MSSLDPHLFRDEHALRDLVDTALPGESDATARPIDDAIAADDRDTL